MKNIRPAAVGFDAKQTHHALNWFFVEAQCAGYAAVAVVLVLFKHGFNTTLELPIFVWLLGLVVQA